MTDIEPPDKRYLVFEHVQYYPSGGMFDMKDSFDNLNEAVEFLFTDSNYYMIYDRVEGVEVATANFNYDFETNTKINILVLNNNYKNELNKQK